MFKTLLAAFKYFPFVLAGVTAVETAMGSTIPGTAKHQVVLDSIVAVARVGEAVPESHVAIVSTMIEGVVGAFNRSGVFNHGVPVEAKQ